MDRKLDKLRLCIAEASCEERLIDSADASRDAERFISAKIAIAAGHVVLRPKSPALEDATIEKGREGCTTFDSSLDKEKRSGNAQRLQVLKKCSARRQDARDNFLLDDTGSNKVESSIP
jgi:hypothetical protein